MIKSIFFIFAMMAGKYGEGAEGAFFHAQSGMEPERLEDKYLKRRYILFTGIPPCCGKSSLIKELQLSLSIPSTVISSDEYQKKFGMGKNSKKRFNDALKNCKESLVFVDKNIPDKCGLDSVIRNLPDGDKEIMS